MKDIKLPNSTTPKSVKKSLIELPPQESAFDTSNWENRNVGAVTFDSETKKRTARNVEFLKAKEGDLHGVPLEEAQRLFLAAKGFSLEQIEQILQVDKTTRMTQDNL